MGKQLTICKDGDRVLHRETGKIAVVVEGELRKDKDGIPHCYFHLKSDEIDVWATWCELEEV